ncbi:MAG: hypothetical protein COB41_00115 [Proteobacteria bacterium]|nr:MAG: hypothetical protein COB41_00115 [Pseudomonadota bacterium]
MNLYITSDCPLQSAKILDDKNIVKMLLDSAQILSTAIIENSGEDFNKVEHSSLKTKKVSVTYYYKDIKLPSPTRKTHPCVNWADKTHSNYGWVYRYFHELCNQYKLRNGSNHELFKLNRYFISGSDFMPAGPLTKFVNCAGNAGLNIDYRDMDNTLTAYKFYLADKWDLDSNIVTWYGK